MALNYGPEYFEPRTLKMEGEVNIDNITRLNGRVGRAFQGYRAAGDWSIPWLWGAALTYPNGVFGEIGFRNGISAAAFCLAAREVKGRVYSIDIEPDLAGPENLKEMGLDSYHTFICGDSKEVDFPEKLDILYIDGDHSYEGVKADFERHAKMVKPGGCIFLHDPVIWPDGVGRFVMENKIFFMPMGCGLGITWVPFEEGMESIRPEINDRPVKVAVA